ncbi:GIN domain-containing protein [Flavobacterium sp. TAB 87]|uniref:GIN domain-containing protein n=1 Tax=Flavobacterium sp. TAB 87 TaxID=1729581 RepID=UPI00076BF4A4|nr:DUF2807 domain-containing protein [Flavobacterium sp. TAB 87]KVV15428.1 hypothetical protein AP058_01095 [Flavobacterium sp. TAB 87]
MKKYTALLLLLLVTTLAFGQRKERLKGSKTVTVEQREIGEFTSVAVEDNIEIYLEKGTKNEIKIEADDNLHEIITLELRDKHLRIYTAKDARIFKKLVVRITYTKDLISVTAKHDASIYAIQELSLEDITIQATDYAKLYLNVNSKKFALTADDKTKTELNLKSEQGSIQLSKSADIKALVSSTDFKCDLYQKATATIEGEATNGTIRLDNNSVFTGNKLTIKNVNLSAENYTSCLIFAEETIKISAADEAEIFLFGKAKVEITRFENEAKLFKKSK